MKIFVTHSSNFDFVNELYRPLRESNLGFSHDFIFPHEMKEGISTKEIIKSSDLVLAEVSYPSTGSGIELGWADMFAKPIICISKEGSKVSKSLDKITSNFISYRDSDDMIAKLNTALATMK